MDPSFFSQAEIDLLLKRAHSGRTAAGDSEPSAKPEPFDFAAAGQLSAEQADQLVELHAEFATKMGRLLGEATGSECAAASRSAVQLAYGELAKEDVETAVFAILETQGLEARVMLHAGLGVVLPLIDRMIGGAGTPPETIRPLTDVEQEIFRPMLRRLGAELQSVWSGLLETSLRPEYLGAAADLVPAKEKVLCIKFEIQIAEQLAEWILILPATVSKALTRKVQQEIARADAGRLEQMQRRMRERLLDSRFRLELFLPPSTVPMRQLAHLKTGQVVVLKPRATDPVQFNLSGIRLFQAVPVRCGARRGAEIRGSAFDSNGQNDSNGGKTAKESR